MAIFFFRTPQQSVIATQADHALTAEEIDKLCWLYGGASLINADHLDGQYIGPRREMITPWSTNAVEITQNMGLKGIRRIEEYTETHPLTPPYEGGEQSLLAAEEATSSCLNHSAPLPHREGQGGGSSFDPMLQRQYNGLDQNIFTVNIQPAPIQVIEDLEAYNEQEGLALSPE